MATTTTVREVNLLRGPFPSKSELYLFEFTVEISGTYLTATKPSFGVLASLQSFMRNGVSAVSVKNVSLLRDLVNSAGTRYGAPNANIVLSGTGNTTVTFRVDSTTAANRNGTADSEVSDATTIAGTFVFAVLVELTLP